MIRRVVHLADLVPPPRKHRHRYHGVFAPDHKLRRAVTALAKRQRRQAARGRNGRAGGQQTYRGTLLRHPADRVPPKPGPLQKPLTHLGEPLEPPPISPARGPPIDCGELVQAHNDRDVFQASPDELPAIDIHNL
jgi:hypothetical protein